MMPQTRTKRIFRWSVSLAIIAVFAVLGWYVGYKTIPILSTRSVICSAVRSASTVHLEEYTGSETLSAKSLTSAEFQSVVDAVPVTAEFGFTEMRSMCFVPHHRVIISDQDTQKRTILEVCFSCQYVYLKDSDSLLQTPLAWREPMRQLFKQYGIPIRSSYATLNNQKQ